MSLGTTIRRWSRGWMIRLMPGMITCKELEGFIVDYLDDSLPDHQRRKFEQHLRFCSSCVRYLENYKKTILLSKTTFNEGYNSNCDDMPEELIQAILASRDKNS